MNPHNVYSIFLLVYVNKSNELQRLTISYTATFFNKIQIAAEMWFKYVEDRR